MALQLFWDAGALSKRFALEIGSDTVAALRAMVPASQMGSTFPGYAETFSILRKRNRGDLNAASYAAAKALLRRGTINSLDFVLLPIETQDGLAGIDLMERHNINSADAAILATFLRADRITGNTSILIAADKRLLRAATAEGLAVLNPETLPADVPAFLNSL